VEVQWESDVETLAGLERLLAAPAASAVIVRGLPNARLVADKKTFELLSSGAFGTVAELREALQRLPPVAAIDPEEVWRLGREAGWEVEIGWSEQGLERIDACFCRPGSQRPAVWVEAPAPRAAGAAVLRRYGTHPAAAQLLELTPVLVPQLRTFAFERLPAPMVPAAFVLLEKLPLNANGKLDRKRLPAPEGGRPQLDREYVAPRTLPEEALAGIWGEVLNLERVGVSDNFFELGGHSLLATQVTSRVRMVFQVDLPLRDLFEHPTVETLCAAIAARLGGEQVMEKIALLNREIEQLSDEEVVAML
jgi:acyl carrier protein